MPLYHPACRTPRTQMRLGTGTTACYRPRPAPCCVVSLSARPARAGTLLGFGGPSALRRESACEFPTPGVPDVEYLSTSTSATGALSHAQIVKSKLGVAAFCRAFGFLD